MCILPVIETRIPKSSVSSATKTGGKTAIVGKIILLYKGDQFGIAADDSVIIASKLFLSVIAMIGKFVESVNTEREDLLRHMWQG